MNVKTSLTLGIAALAAAAGALTLGGAADAATTQPVPGNVTVIPGVRTVDYPGRTLAANTTVKLQFAGSTFGGVTIPSNATAVEMTVTVTSGDGNLTFWPDGAGQPGTSSVYSSNGPSTSVVLVPLGADGAADVRASSAMRYADLLQAYYTPLAATPTFTIAATDKALEHIGPSVRTDNSTPGSGATDMGAVTLPAGTYRADVVGGFAGFKRTADLGQATVYGYLGLTKGETIPAGFATVLAQAQGTVIPQTNSGSDTYTIDPTQNLDAVFTLTSSTEVHLMAYGYSSNGADLSSLGEHADIQSATFTKLG